MHAFARSVIDAIATGVIVPILIAGLESLSVESSFDSQGGRS